VISKMREMGLNNDMLMQFKVQPNPINNTQHIIYVLLMYRSLNIDLNEFNFNSYSNQY
jgi:hypothetical protein